jgi:hypothetical protein
MGYLQGHQALIQRGCCQQYASEDRKPRFATEFVSHEGGNSLLLKARAEGDDWQKVYIREG